EPEVLIHARQYLAATRQLNNFGSGDNLPRHQRFFQIVDLDPDPRHPLVPKRVLVVGRVARLFPPVVHASARHCDEHNYNQQLLRHPATPLNSSSRHCPSELNAELLNLVTAQRDEILKTRGTCLKIPGQHRINYPLSVTLCPASDVALEMQSRD